MTESVVYWADLPTGVSYGRLPVDSWSYTDTLSAPGQFQCTIPLKTAITADIAATSLLTARTSVWIERAGSLLFGGILWTKPQGDPASNTLQLAGEGFHSYFDERAIHETLVFTGVEQTSIAAQIIDYLQSKPSGDIGITTPATFDTTTALSRTYQSFEHRNAREVLDEFPALDGGFDFRYVPYRDPITGRFRAAWLPLYPTTGRETNHKFVLGSNCQAFTVSENGKDIATQVTAIGAGSGSSTLTATATAASLARGFPLLEKVDTYSDTTDLSTLQSKARLHARVNAYPTVIPTLSVSPDADPPLGSYVVGDAVDVYGQYGLLTLDGRYKITQLSVTRTPTDGEVAAVTLAPQEVFA